MSRVLAQAIVDVDLEPEGGRLGVFRVEVWGKPPHDYTRTYTIRAKSDNLAAQEGLRRFTEEVEEMIAEKG
jgi:hypothetical protein